MNQLLIDSFLDGMSDFFGCRTALFGWARSPVSRAYLAGYGAARQRYLDDRGGRERRLAARGAL